MRGNSHVRCEVGENLAITSKDYLSLCLILPNERREFGKKFDGENYREGEHKDERVQPADGRR